MKQKDFNQIFVTVVASRSAAPVELLAQIKNGPVLSARRALEVYQEDYEARLTEALKNTYRGINAIIGDEDFFILSQDYINTHPSSSSDLDDYGHLLSLHLKDHQLSKDYIFLPELAFFEWNFREVFHQEQIPGLSPEGLMACLENDRDMLRLCSSLRLLHFNFLITSLYALKDEEDKENELIYEFPEYVLMYKNGVMVKTITLSKNQFEILKKLLAPASLQHCLQNAPATVTPDEIQTLFTILGTERLLLKLN
ncbi:MAG: DNA-binding domain-containing protein [Bacteriovorax sp.]|jgi:hypothetical protein